jgi:hypothetical protein
LGPSLHRMVQRFTTNLKRYKATLNWEDNNRIFFEGRYIKVRKI